MKNLHENSSKKLNLSENLHENWLKNPNCRILHENCRKKVWSIPVMCNYRVETSDVAWPSFSWLIELPRDRIVTKSHARDPCLDRPNGTIKGETGILGSKKGPKNMVRTNERTDAHT